MTGPRSLHVISSLCLNSGGPTQSVAGLCRALNDLDSPAEIATVRAPGEDALRPTGTPVHIFTSQAPARLRRSPGLAEFLQGEARRFDLIHVHGLWEWPGRYARLAASKSSRPLVVSPRGMLEPWALSQNAQSKRLAMILWERANLNFASMLHATSPAEAIQFGRLGLQNPVAIIPNGVDLPAPEATQPAAPPTILFLSRFHPKKGADLLLKAWAGIPDHRGWRLVLAGPDEIGYRSTLEALSNELGIHERVVFLGPQFGDDKWALLRQSSLLVLPSLSENFGNVVLEALSQGVPVITTHGTPWAEVVARRCGWWVEPTTHGIQAAMMEALRLPRHDLLEMGHRGRDWASAFTWETIAQSMIEAYSGLNHQTLFETQRSSQ